MELISDYLETAPCLLKNFFPMLLRSLCLFFLIICANISLSAHIVHGAVVSLPSKSDQSSVPAPKGSKASVSVPKGSKASVPQKQNLYVSDPTVRSLPLIQWTNLSSGLDLGITRLPASEHMGIADYFIILRADPKHFNFNLHMASEAGSAHFLHDWMQLKELSVGINASMYLPDNKTSTGLMRSKSHVNNARAGRQMGAFFVADPLDNLPGSLADSLPGNLLGSKLPSVDILDREETNNLQRLQQYQLVVQNYRFWNRAGTIQWSQNGPMTSIAAVGKDTKGRILFLLSQEKLSAAAFAAYARAFPLDIIYLMYAEGGSPAGLALRLPLGSKVYNLLGSRRYNTAAGNIYVWRGRGGLLRAMGVGEEPLPNIIGAKAVSK